MDLSILKKRFIAIFTISLCLTGLLLVSSCEAADEQKGKTEAKVTTDNSPVLLKIGEHKITDNQLKERFRGEVFQAESRYYQLRKSLLNRMADDYLLEKEAKRRKLSKQKLIQKEVEKKTKRVSKKDVEKFFNENLKNNPRFGKKTLADVEPQIRAHLKRKNQMQRRSAYLEKLRRKNKVELMISPPVIEVSYTSHNAVKGPKNAPIEIIEFSDFQCPYCTKAKGTVDKVLKKYRGKIRLVFRHFPLGFHRQAKKAAIAAQCANDQGKFWEYHDLLFAKKKGLEEAGLKEYAIQLKLNEKKFTECLTKNKYEKDVQQDMADGQKAGVRGTPAFFINGQMLSGAQPMEAFVAVIEEELKRHK